MLQQKKRKIFCLRKEKSNLGFLTFSKTCLCLKINKVWLLQFQFFSSHTQINSHWTFWLARCIKEAINSKKIENKDFIFFLLVLYSCTEGIRIFFNSEGKSWKLYLHFDDEIIVGGISMIKWKRVGNKSVNHIALVVWWIFLILQLFSQFSFHWFSYIYACIYVT